MLIPLEMRDELVIDFMARTSDRSGANILMPLHCVRLNRSCAHAAAGIRRWAKSLRQQLGQVADGSSDAGVTAPSFADFSADYIRDSFKVMMQMAVVLTFGLSLPVVKVARMAGQFAKPRSAPMETIDGVELPSYRGDMVNGIDFTEADRVPIRTGSSRSIINRRRR